MGKRRKADIYWVPTLCQVLYTSHFVSPYFADLSGLTTSIHEIRKLRLRRVKITEQAVSRTGPLFPDCLGGCLLLGHYLLSLFLL